MKANRLLSSPEAGGTWQFLHTLLSFSSLAEPLGLGLGSGGRMRTGHILAVSAAGLAAV